MRSRIVLAALGCAALVPSVAGAVPIHVHKKVPVEREVVKHELVKGEPFITTDTVMATKTVERVKHVPPADEDDDGIADHKDSCIGYCAPEPVYTESSAGAYTAAPSGTLGAIAACESGGDYTAVDPSGTYGGAYQFDQSTWESVGGTGSPEAAPPAEQDMRAQLLYDQAGAAPWPVCGQ